VPGGSSLQGLQQLDQSVLLDLGQLFKPGGLAFSEFRGYEAWQAISISRNDRVVAMILGDPVMIDAYSPAFNTFVHRSILAKMVSASLVQIKRRGSVL
jgi:hypothetical protein